jgi:hypothetical protein
MPEVGFEPTITASERAKTVHALDSSATVTGSKIRKILNSDSKVMQLVITFVASN